MQEIHYFSVLFLNDTFKFNYHQLIWTQQQHLCSKCGWPELSDHCQKSSRGRSRDTDGISGHSPRHAAAGSAALHRPRHRHHHPGLHNHRSWLFWNTAHILSGNLHGAVVAREFCSAAAVIGWNSRLTTAPQWFPDKMCAVQWQCIQLNTKPAWKAWSCESCLTSLP